MGFLHCDFDLLHDNDCLAVTFYPIDHFPAIRQYFRDIGSLEHLFLSFYCMQSIVYAIYCHYQEIIVTYCYLYLPLSLASLIIYDCLPS